MKVLKLISWNVNGIRAVFQKNFQEFLNSENPDIVGIQETKIQENQLTEEIKNIDGYYSYWFSAERKGYSGVAVYTKKKPLNILKGIQNPEFDIEGRVITLEYEDFFFVCCYYPNAQELLKRIRYKHDFNIEILKFCNQLRLQKTVIICGDYNVAHRSIDLYDPQRNLESAGYSEQEREDMDRFLNAGYIDTFRFFNQEAGQYTWWSYRFHAREKNIGWRIDYFCIDQKSQSRLISNRILSHVVGSDHCPIQLEITAE